MKSGGLNRKLTTLWRIFLSGTNNFVRNAWLSAAAMAVMIITLTIVLFSVIANATCNYTVQQIRDKIDISVYLKDDVTEAQRNTLTDNLKNITNVKSVGYRDWETDRKSTRLNSSHSGESRMPSSA